MNFMSASSKLVFQSVVLKCITTKVGDEAKQQYHKLLDDIVPDHREKFLLCDKFACRVYVFYAEYLSGKGFESLCRVFILIFCLSHGQSSIERGFKTNKEFEVENLSESSLISLCVINDHMRSKCVNAANIPLTRELIVTVRSTRSRYMQSLEQQRSVKKVTRKT